MTVHSFSDLCIHSCWRLLCFAVLFCDCFDTLVQVLLQVCHDGLFFACSIKSACVCAFSLIPFAGLEFRTPSSLSPIILLLSTFSCLDYFLVLQLLDLED